MSTTYGLQATSSARNDNGESTTLLPLKEVTTTAAVVGWLAEVTLRQTYVNDCESPIEAVYTFPVDPRGAINGFRVSFADGREVRGDVQEREEAKDTYDDAISMGMGGYLVEMDAEMPDVFRASVGNLPPGGEVTIELAYTTECDQHGQDLRLVIPNHVAPRAGHGRNWKNSSEVLQAAEATVSDPRQTSTARGTTLAALATGGCDSATYSASVRVSVSGPDAVGGRGVSELTSPSHPNCDVQWDIGDGSATAVVTSQSGGLGGDDFVLHIRAREPHRPQGWIERPAPTAAAPRSAAVMLSLLPEYAAASAASDGGGGDDDASGEYIFLVDRSGSMAGSKMRNTQACLQLCVSALPEGSTFNIISFGTRIESLYPGGSVAFDDGSKAAAINHIKTMAANLGGTNLLEPLAEMAGRAPSPDRPRQVFLLTDGQVSNCAECLSFVGEQRRATGTRFFSFGIGSGASHALVRGVAERGGGLSEFIVAGEESTIRAVVMRQLEMALQPALSGIDVNWAGAGLALADADSSAPRLLPPLFGGSRLCVYALVDLDASSAASMLESGGHADVRVSATTSDGRRVAFDVPVAFRCPPPSMGNAAPAATSTLLHSSAALALIRDCERAVDYGGGGGDGDGGGHRQRGIALSLEHKVQSRWTSFVAVEQRSDPTTQAIELVSVPGMSLTTDVARSKVMAGLGTDLTTSRLQSTLQAQAASLQAISLDINSEMVTQNSILDSMCASSWADSMHRVGPVYRSASLNWGGGGRVLKRCAGGGGGLHNTVGASTQLYKMSSGPSLLGSVSSSVASVVGAIVSGIDSLATAATGGGGPPPPPPAAAAPAAVPPSPAKTLSTEQHIHEIGAMFGSMSTLMSAGGGEVERVLDADSSVVKSDLVEIIALQSASGSWMLTPALAAALGQTLNAVRAALGAGGDGPAHVTALVLSFLEVKCPSLRSEWKLADAKARKWLARQDRDDNAGSEEDVLRQSIASW